MGGDFLSLTTGVAAALLLQQNAPVVNAAPLTTRTSRETSMETQTPAQSTLGNTSTTPGEAIVQTTNETRTTGSATVTASGIAVQVTNETQPTGSDVSQNFTTGYHMGDNTTGSATNESSSAPSDVTTPRNDLTTERTIVKTRITGHFTTKSSTNGNSNSASTATADVSPALHHTAPVGTTTRAPNDQTTTASTPSAATANTPTGKVFSTSSFPDKVTGGTTSTPAPSKTTRPVVRSEDLDNLSDLAANVMHRANESCRQYVST